MKSCAVVIGVDRVGGLPPLSAAALGAGDFDKWCDTKTIDTTLITDEVDDVTILTISMAIAKYINSHEYHQMFIYFAGHGILKSPDEEYWLLSGAPAAPYEAVNVITSVAYARTAPLKHIIYISDACRTEPHGLMNGVKGMGVFPNCGNIQTRPKNDQYYATAPGDPAYEARLNSST